MKEKKPRKIKFDVIEDRPESEPYRILRDIRRRYHSDLAEANIALAWQHDVKADVDGHLKLGMCVKAADLQKEFHDWDFIVVLNKIVWEDTDFTLEKKEALVDHELCHAAPALDKDLEHKQDARGRYLWRTRKHDIEEFHAIVVRHGCYKRDLERFADALLKKRTAPLFSDKEITSPELVTH